MNILPGLQYVAAVFAKHPLRFGNYFPIREANRRLTAINLMGVSPSHLLCGPTANYRSIIIIG